MGSRRATMPAGPTKLSSFPGPKSRDNLCKPLGALKYRDGDEIDRPQKNLDVKLLAWNGPSSCKEFPITD